MYTEYTLVRDGEEVIVRETKYKDGATMSVRDYAAKFERAFVREYPSGMKADITEYSCFISGDRKLFRLFNHLNNHLSLYTPAIRSPFKQIELE